MQTDRLDLWQIHNISSVQQVQTLFQKDRAIDVFQKAKADGITRFIGITVHSSRRVIDETLSRCQAAGIAMDTLLISFNPADEARGGHGKQILQDHSAIGKIAMKVFGSDSAPIIHREKVSGEATLRYVLSHGFATAIVGTHTLAELEENVAVARRFSPLGDEELRQIENQIRRPSNRLFTLNA